MNPDLPILPALLEFSEVHAAAGEHINKLYLYRKLRKAKVTRRVGGQQKLVSSEALSKVDPELYRAVIQRRMLR